MQKPPGLIIRLLQLVGRIASRHGSFGDVQSAEYYRAAASYSAPSVIPSLYNAARDCQTRHRKSSRFNLFSFLYF